jgi:archaeal preflagellin peptidase FlaK
VSQVGEWLVATEIALLLVGFVYASIADLRTREVSDRLWQVLGVVALALGAVQVGPGGTLPLALWFLVGLLTLQHMFAWDSFLGGLGERFADLLELAFYLVVITAVAFAAARVGVGPTGVPYAVIAVLLTVIFARGLFEVGVLYGGADAKALMVAGFLVPVFANPWYVPDATTSVLNSVLPFAVNLLMDAALASVVVPIALAIRNLRRREFSFPRGFTGYSLPIDELPDRYVWVRDPAVTERGKDEEAGDTSEDDRNYRTQVAEQLRAKGIARVWVTPQLPFIVLMTIGAVAALLAGNLVVDLLALA